jgi:hypothetical protein
MKLDSKVCKTLYCLLFQLLEVNQGQYSQYFIFFFAYEWDQ